MPVLFALQYVLKHLGKFVLVHEVLIERNLMIKKKDLPSDEFYKAVLIRQSRRKLAVSDVNDGSDYDDIVNSDY